MSRDYIIVVSGLPRSGTSMMMQILEAGGVEILTDNLRSPDSDNSKGYYEYEKVKNLHKDNYWLKKCQGKTIKIVSNLIKNLRSDMEYKIIFMERDITEVLSSQSKMLKNAGLNDSSSDMELKNIFLNHIKEIKIWLQNQTHMEILFVNHKDCIYNSEFVCQDILRFLDMNLNYEEMVKVVDVTMYRNRS